MLRDATAGDQATARAVILDGLRERWGAAFDESLNPDLDDIWESYIATGGEFVVAEIGGLIVGCGALRIESGSQARILRVSVAAAARRRGIGMQIVNELVRRARRRGVREVLVLTDSPWESAIALYRACGFQEVEVDATDTHFALRL